MPHLSPSALVTNQGERVLLRIEGHHYDLGQQELRRLLKLPTGPAGLGITIDDDCLFFEFTDHPVVKLSAKQLVRRLAKRTEAQAR